LLFVGALGAILHTGAALAQSSRTFVSAATGSDGNDCSRSAPCRTFQGAHDKTNDQGEITVLDPGGYGGVTITKSISIVNDGVGEASLLVSGGTTGIVVNAGAAGYVNLRGIVVQGIGFGGGTGIRLASAFALTITNCVVRNHTHNGIEIMPNTASSVTVSNSLVADNGGDGILVQPGAGASVKAVFKRVELSSNSVNGLAVFTSNTSNASVNATVADSVAAGNGFFGFVVNAGPNAQVSEPVRLWVTRSVIANNRFGVQANGVAPSSLKIGESVLTGNNVTWSNTGMGSVNSFVDNYIFLNQDFDPAPPTFPQQ
jgi:hypothetical protein